MISSKNSEKARPRQPPSTATYKVTCALWGKVLELMQSRGPPGMVRDRKMFVCPSFFQCKSCWTRPLGHKREARPSGRATKCSGLQTSQDSLIFPLNVSGNRTYSFTCPVSILWRKTNPLENSIFVDGWAQEIGGILLLSASGFLWFKCQHTLKW